MKTKLLIFPAVAVLFLSLFSIAACGKPTPPSEAVAKRFMDAYYVQINLPEAAKDCSGLALERVNSSIQLTQGVKPDSGNNKPKISYKLIEGKSDADEASYFFELKISPDGISPITQRTRLTVRKMEAGDWKVTQFFDYDRSGNL
jgi:hypothetical protein